MAKNLFVNLPVKDVERSRRFFNALGFSINEQFSDDKAICVVLGENLFAMLLKEEYFQTFTKKPLSDATKSTEVLIALDVDSREAVDKMIETAQKEGGSIYSEAADHGWMYQHAFADLDGHQWEIAYMDESQLT